MLPLQMGCGYGWECCPLARSTNSCLQTKKPRNLSLGFWVVVSHWVGTTRASMLATGQCVRTRLNLSHGAETVNPHAATCSRTAKRVDFWLG